MICNEYNDAIESGRPFGQPFHPPTQYYLKHECTTSTILTCQILHDFKLNDGPYVYTNGEHLIYTTHARQLHILVSIWLCSKLMPMNVDVEFRKIGNRHRDYRAMKIESEYNKAAETSEHKTGIQIESLLHTAGTCPHGFVCVSVSSGHIFLTPPNQPSQ